jgi:hypothetical protein
MARAGIRAGIKTQYLYSSHSQINYRRSGRDLRPDWINDFAQNAELSQYEHL